MIGKTLAHYEINGLLGKGGMGEVYRARDPRLDRDVAIKVLPSEVARDAERTARFEREAKVLAQINHSHVAQIHGFDRDGDVHFLVMELVEGEDLAVRLRDGAIPVTEALALARQIAEGLEQAHARGIVHRDLKPANVQITPDGTAKILDFGLAVSRAPVDGTADTQLSPTITAALTQAGTLLGTAAYMSPEQAAGRVCDQRADVWAWGVIVYEMLTGRRLFGEDSPSETLAAVIRAEPDWEALPKDVSPATRRILEGCLRKKPHDRWHAIADVRLMLDDVDAPAPSVDAPRSGLRPHPVWIAIALVGLAIGWFLPRGSTSDVTTQQTPVVRSAIELPADTQLAGWASPTIALAPDGRTVAFVAMIDGHKRLFVRHLEDEEAFEVPASDGAEGPFFSPDGRWIGFGAGAISGGSDEPRRLKKFDLQSGSTTDVCELGDYFGGTWARDGTIYFANLQPRGLWSVSAEGGTPRRCGADDPERRQGFAWPQVLPDGERAVAISWEGRELGRVVIVDLRSGDATDLGLAGSFARWSPSGHLFVANEAREVVAHRFDPFSATLGEGIVTVLDDVSFTGNEAAVFDVSSSGDLVYTAGPVDGGRSDLSRLFSIDRSGSVEPVAIGADYFSGLEVAPDGERLALAVGGRDLWVHDLVRGTRLRLPAGDLRRRGAPLWTEAGDAIVFTGEGTSGGASLNLYLQSADGVGEPTSLESRTGEFYARTWEPRSRTLLFDGFVTSATDQIEPRIYRMDLDAPQVTETLALNESGVRRPAISPDGRWLAYASAETGRTEVFLRSYPGLARKIPVGPGIRMRWTTDGRELVVIRGDRWAVRAAVTHSFDPETGEVGAPRAWADFAAIEHPDFDPDGALTGRYDATNDRFFFLQEIPGAGEVHALRFVQNWIDEVEALLPGGAAR